MRNLLLLVSLLLTGHLANAQKWQNLFDGKTLAGWHTLPGGHWEAKNGMIVGLSEKTDTRHGLLITDKSYKNFILSVQYKANKGNSGLYFRAEEVGGWAGVSGFQAEIDPEKDAGGLYETNGRAWVVQPTPEQVKTWYKPGQWNTMTVTAKGRDVVVTVNGQKTARLDNDSGRTQGRIALQLHGGMDMDVLFKDLKIKQL
ncbi:MAG: DUF1080 domain-containing protein [Cytophagaceae bacterium]|nr:DUF1080 domain-containing protein [Cytophagaceae bacterium]